MSYADTNLGILAITAADTNLPFPTRAVWVDGTGTLVVTDASNASNPAVTLSNVAAGVWHPMNVIRIAAASTATGIKIQY